MTFNITTVTDTFGDIIEISATPTAVAFKVTDPDGNWVTRFITINEAEEVATAIIEVIRELGPASSIAASSLTMQPPRGVA